MTKKIVRSLLSARQRELGPKRLESGFWYTLMLGLLYPAILGSIFYSVLGVLLEPHQYLTNPQLVFLLVLALAVVIHFCVDFMYISLLTNYDLRQFLVDLLVIGLLYKAFLSIDPTKSSHDIGVFFAFFMVIYLIFLPQELFILIHYVRTAKARHAAVHARMVGHTSISAIIYGFAHFYYKLIPSAIVLVAVTLISIHYAYILYLRYRLEQYD
jgi:hypothetical protein